MRLPDLQSAFQDWILHRRDRVDGLVRGGGRVPVVVRLGVYEHAYAARLVEALGTTYPALKATLGADEFAAIATAFLRENPSRHASIRYYGRELGAFVAARRPGMEGTTLRELAEWEWMLADVFDGPDALPLPLARLSALPPEEWPEVTFVPHPTLRRCRTRTNAVAAWRGATGAGELVSRLEQAPHTEWIAWRRELTTLFRSMAPDETAAVDALCRGEPFEEICHGLMEHVDPDAVAVRAATLLRTWVSEGLVADLCTEAT